MIGSDEMALPSTAERVQLSTKETVNYRINRQTINNISQHLSKDSSELTERIAELNYEWDTERTLETSASVLVLISISLGLFHSQFWFVVSALVAFFLLVHALIGWCPPLPIIRRKGIRTTTEICEEKVALKQLRGDFNSEHHDAENLMAQSKL